MVKKCKWYTYYLAACTFLYPLDLPLFRTNTEQIPTVQSYLVWGIVFLLDTACPNFFPMRHYLHISSLTWYSTNPRNSRGIFRFFPTDSNGFRVIQRIFLIFRRKIPRNFAESVKKN
jgi:hypothetical protein